MAQVKIYGLADKLEPIRQQLSDCIHACVMGALQFPANKRAHRFFPLQKENFFYPEGRSEAYTIIEIRMISGRSEAARKKLVRLLFDTIERDLGLLPVDLEVCIQEQPACNWGFRGLHGDEAQLDYAINV